MDRIVACGTKDVRKVWKPKWKGAIEGYAVNFARQSEWRTLPEYDYTDLIQEFWLTYQILRGRYTTVTDPKHFMALFKVSTRNRVTQIAKRRTYRRLKGDGNHYPTVPGYEGEEMELLAGSVVYDLDVQVMLETAPPAIKRVVKQLVESELQPNYETYGSGRRKEKQTTNEYLCGLIGWDPTERNLSAYIKNWLKGDTLCIR